MARFHLSLLLIFIQLINSLKRCNCADNLDDLSYNNRYSSESDPQATLSIASKATAMKLTVDEPTTHKPDVSVSIYHHQSIHDPMQNYGNGKPWNYFGNGYGIRYGYDLDGSYSREKGYRYEKAHGREFCKPGKRCHDDKAETTTKLSPLQGHIFGLMKNDQIDLKKWFKQGEAPSNNNNASNGKKSINQKRVAITKNEPFSEIETAKRHYPPLSHSNSHPGNAYDWSNLKSSYNDDAIQKNLNPNFPEKIKFDDNTSRKTPQTKALIKHRYVASNPASESVPRESIEDAYYKKEFEENLNINVSNPYSVLETKHISPNSKSLLDKQNYWLYK